MRGSRKAIHALTVLGIVAAACVLAAALWFVTSPRNYRSVVVQVRSQTQGDPVATAYVDAFLSTNQIVEELAANPEFIQIKTVDAKTDAQAWLQEHLHIRRIQDDRIEIIGTARSWDVTAHDLETVIRLATDAVLTDAASNDLQAEVISHMSAAQP